MSATSLDDLSIDPVAPEGEAAAGAVVARPVPSPPGPPALSPAWRAAVIGGLVTVIGAGLVLRFWTRSAMWLDEALTVDIARLPLHDLRAALRRDGAPPLYYVLLHFWIRAFGTSDLAARSLSGLFSVATIPLVWLAARRLGGRTVAWSALALFVSAPFSIYYATEARMYALVMLLTTCGILAIERTLRRARPGNVAAVTVVTAALLYTHYWSVYLTAATALWLGALAWRARRRRTPSEARWALLGLALGWLVFVPWLPTFFFQTAHTGTPWSTPGNFAAIINGITGFTSNQASLITAPSNQSELLALSYFLLALLALFGTASSRWHVMIDLRTHRPGRDAGFVVIVTLALAVIGGLLTGSAFTHRYASVVFIPLIVLVAMGITTFGNPRVRVGIMAVAVLAGLGVGVENIWTQRSQAPEVATVLAAQARPGDIIAFCPDQLGPSVNRLLPPGRFETITFPRGTGPEFVDWIDYQQVVMQANPARFARMLEARAGTTHQIWLVWAPGYVGFVPKCQQLAGYLLDAPGYGAHQWVTVDPSTYYEQIELVQFAPPSRSPPH